MRSNASFLKEFRVMRAAPWEVALWEFLRQIQYSYTEVPLVFRLPRGGVHATSFSFC